MFFVSAALMNMLGTAWAVRDYHAPKPAKFLELLLHRIRYEKIHLLYLCCFFQFILQSFSALSRMESDLDDNFLENSSLFLCCSFCLFFCVIVIQN